MKDTKKFLSALALLALTVFGYYQFAPETQTTPHTTPTNGGNPNATAPANPSGAPDLGQVLMQGPQGMTDIAPTLERIRQGILYFDPGQTPDGLGEFDRVIRVPAGLGSKAELLEVLARELNFPEMLNGDPPLAAEGPPRRSGAMEPRRAGTSALRTQ